ncbi:hypothetical protein HOLleu_44688 [Holothuria leucospilota]|uniref:Uncharacterized protein n=1 Tax=Holothuria leucospilota TaxID=206669 RepID=A0A9Q0Y9G1_HOLLE|nr:hypothetical protein HOLleu_44688 [Holothuria leucospilota]
MMLDLVMRPDHWCPVIWSHHATIAWCQENNHIAKERLVADWFVIKFKGSSSGFKICNQFEVSYNYFCDIRCDIGLINSTDVSRCVNRTPISTYAH